MNQLNINTILLNKVCYGSEPEPQLIPVTTEQMRYRTANTSDESRLYIKEKAFWRRGQTAFCDVLDTYVNCRSKKNLQTSVIFHNNEKEKNRTWNE